MLLCRENAHSHTRNHHIWCRLFRLSFLNRRWPLVWSWSVINDGNFKGPLMLSVKEGYVLGKHISSSNMPTTTGQWSPPQSLVGHRKSLPVMRGNSAEVARHVMCPSRNNRISLTFFNVQTPPATYGVMHPSNIPHLQRRPLPCANQGSPTPSTERIPM